MSVLEDRKARGVQDIEGRQATPVQVTDKYRTGKKNLQELTRKEEKIPTGVNAFAPVVDTFLKEHLFADIFTRDVLDHQMRELVTVSALKPLPLFIKRIDSRNERKRTNQKTAKFH